MDEADGFPGFTAVNVISDLENTQQKQQFTMGPPAVSLFLVVVLGLTATLPAGPTMVHAEGSHAHDLLDDWISERDTRLTERSTDRNSKGLQQSEDTCLNRMDSRFDFLETMMIEMKQRMATLEVMMELVLMATNQTGEVTTPESQPTATPQMPKDCQEVYTRGSTSSGVYRIAPEPNTQFDVLCEQELDGGGWTVFQLRKDGTVDFYQDWDAYKQGFGLLTGEFWLGNTNIHLLSRHNDQELKIQLTSPEGEVAYANYRHFSIGDESLKYTLNISGYSGGFYPGDNLYFSNGGMFSTKDADNDGVSLYSWAKLYEGAWWYKRGGTHCNLNGPYGGSGGKGVWWEHWKGLTSLKATRMMMRKKR